MGKRKAGSAAADKPAKASSAGSRAKQAREGGKACELPRALEAEQRELPGLPGLHCSGEPEAEQRELPGLPGLHCSGEPEAEQRELCGLPGLDCSGEPEAEQRELPGLPGLDCSGPSASSRPDLPSSSASGRKGILKKSKYLPMPSDAAVLEVHSSPEKLATGLRAARQEQSKGARRAVTVLNPLLDRLAWFLEKHPEQASVFERLAKTCLARVQEAERALKRNLFNELEMREGSAHTFEDTTALHNELHQLLVQQLRAL